MTGTSAVVISPSPAPAPAMRRRDSRSHASLNVTWHCLPCQIGTSTTKPQVAKKMPNNTRLFCRNHAYGNTCSFLTLPPSAPFFMHPSGAACPPSIMRRDLALELEAQHYARTCQIRAQTVFAMPLYMSVAAIGYSGRPRPVAGCNLRRSVPHG